MYIYIYIYIYEITPGGGVAKNGFRVVPYDTVLWLLGCDLELADHWQHLHIYIYIYIFREGFCSHDHSVYAVVKWLKNHTVYAVVMAITGSKQWHDSGEVLTRHV